ncbi:MAG: InlB B-repeat-containing protein [Lachnospiraceae bacterium]|nr:InlB B-repeat-containing protein [Lachnospiraceae bacterium]
MSKRRFFKLTITLLVMGLMLTMVPKQVSASDDDDTIWTVYFHPSSTAGSYVKVMNGNWLNPLPTLYSEDAVFMGWYYDYNTYYDQFLASRIYKDLDLYARMDPILKNASVTVVAPVAGNRPNTTQIVHPSGAHYAISSVKFIEYDNGPVKTLGSKDVFVKGKTYQVVVGFRPQDNYKIAVSSCVYNGVTYFAPTKVRINNNIAKLYDDFSNWTLTYDTDLVTEYYTFFYTPDPDMYCALYFELNAPNNTTAAGGPSAINTYFGDTITIPSKRPSCSGYTFLGWSTDENADEAEYQPGDTYQVRSEWADRLYAVWAKKPSIKAHPEDVAVLPGETAEFSVLALGYKSLTYQWQYQVPGSTNWTDCTEESATTATLSIIADNALCGYSYRCFITDAAGVSVVSNPATFHACPVITHQPRNVKTSAGSTATLSLTATGAEPLSYQWQSRKDENSAWSNSGMAGAKTDTLKVTVSGGLYGWKFRCIVTDAHGVKTISKAVSLSINPTITKNPENKTVQATYAAIFNVEAIGPKPLTYQWQERADATQEWTNSSEADSDTSQLIVGTAIGKHGYQYRCIVTAANGLSRASSPATLILIPRIMKQPVNRTMSVGTTAPFTVEVRGKATISYQWQSRKNESSNWSNSGQPGAKTATLSVNVIAGLDGWQFRCIITDGNGQRNVTDVVTLRVKTDTPKITTQPVDQTVTTGANATFSVAALCTETMTYQWQSRKDANSAWTNSGQSGAKTETLTVATIPGLNGWQFRCIVTAANGKKATSNVATLTVLPVITQEPTDATAAAGEKAIFTVKANGKGLTYRWQSRKNADAAWTNSGQSGAKTDTLTVSMLAGLNGWQFRCVVTDANGQKAYSKEAVLKKGEWL